MKLIEPFVENLSILIIIEGKYKKDYANIRSYTRKLDLFELKDTIKFIIFKYIAEESIVLLRYENESN
jgi:hypothetical protein